MGALSNSRLTKLFNTATPSSTWLSVVVVVTMAEVLVALPGDTIDASRLPTAQKRKLGLGIKQDTDSNDFTSTIAGRLEVDQRKKSAHVSSPRSRYIARSGDSIIAQGALSHFAFEGASKKTRPQLRNGDVVYAKIASAQKNMDIELTCVNPNTGKADGLGPLNEGMLFDVSLEFAERLLKKQLSLVLDELGNKIPGGFELVVGKNGKVWIDCGDSGAKGVVAVGRVLQSIDGEVLQEKEQKKLVNRILRDMGLL